MLLLCQFVTRDLIGWKLQSSTYMYLKKFQFFFYSILSELYSSKPWMKYPIFHQVLMILYNGNNIESIVYCKKGSRTILHFATVLHFAYFFQRLLPFLCIINNKKYMISTKFSCHLNILVTHYTINTKYLSYLVAF